MQVVVLKFLSKGGNISKFTTSENILNYTLYSWSFGFVINIPNQELKEMVTVNIFILLFFNRMNWYMNFKYYIFMALCPSSTQKFNLTFSITAQYTGSNYTLLAFYEITNCSQFQVLKFETSWLYFFWVEDTDWLWRGHFKLET